MKVCICGNISLNDEIINCLERVRILKISKRAVAHLVLGWDVGGVLNGYGNRTN